MQVDVQSAPATVWNLNSRNGWHQLACDAFFLSVALCHVISALKALQRFRLQRTVAVCFSFLSAHEAVRWIDLGILLPLHAPQFPLLSDTHHPDFQFCSFDSEQAILMLPAVVMQAASRDWKESPGLPTIEFCLAGAYCLMIALMLASSIVR